MLTLEKGIKALQSAGAKITSQRIAIMRSLEGRMDHPSAETIYLELRSKYPTLSIATVYSTARLLAQASLARILSIDDKKIYYDPNTSPHGHFMCKVCKKLIDVPISCESFGDVTGIDGVSSVTNGEFFLYGICTDCAE